MKYTHIILGPQPAGLPTTNILQAKALGPLSRGRELKKALLALGRGFPVGLLWLQAAEVIDFPGSRPSSSPLVVSVAKETNLGWWYALLLTLKCSCPSPRNVGHIFILSTNQRVVSSPSAQGFSTATHLHDYHVWVRLGAGWPYHLSPGPKFTPLNALFTPKQ